MSGIPSEMADTPPVVQADFEQITKIVSAEFQLDEALMEHGIPTYYLKQPQETKQAFLKVLRNLEGMRFIALLRKTNGKLVLRVISKPATKPSNVLINWILLFATIATTFVTGYYFPQEAVNPLVSGATFTIALMAVIGTHEIAHKLAANRRKIDATPPYFIPGPPAIPGSPIQGIGTFGAVIMQKSLPPNKDSLFDIGSSGPLIGFFVTVIVTVIGLVLSPFTYRLPEGPFSPVPVLFNLITLSLSVFGFRGAGNMIIVHPIAVAGIIGMIVTMLQLLPTGTLDGGHVARSVLGDKMRSLLTIASIAFLVITGYYPMAFLVLLLSMFKYPGPLDDVSSLSKTRKAIIPLILIVFIVCGLVMSEPCYGLEVKSNVPDVEFKIYYADSMYYINRTDWTSILAQGEYLVQVPQNWTVNNMYYVFSHWEDYSTNLTRIVFLNEDTSITTFYTISYL